VEFQVRNLPKLNSKYWVSLIAASVFGTSTGDFVSDYLHLGHLSGIPILLAVLAATFMIEKVSTWSSAIFFWAAIITIRTAATNVGDSFHDFGINFNVSIPLVASLFIAAVAIYKSGAAKDMRSDGSVRVNGPYWLCMCLAGILGTLAGDFTSFVTGLGTLGASLALGAGVAAMLFRGKSGQLLQPFYYWATVALIRSAGTAAGDFLAHGIGLGLSTAVTGLVFIAFILVFYGFEKNNVAGTGSASQVCA
jgi:uncharacterized membrane-anchored protein